MKYVVLCHMDYGNPNATPMISGGAHIGNASGIWDMSYGNFSGGSTTRATRLSKN